MQESASELLEKGIHIKFSKAVKQLLDENSTLVVFPKDKTVIYQGDNCSSIYFIISGIVRGYYVDENGNDITKCFASENEFFATEGLRTNNPSSFHIECLEECKCIQIQNKLINRLMDEDNDFYKTFNQYILKVMQDLENRTRDLVMKNAEERYRIFMEQYPMLHQRISQKYIASYIGIRESSLSRIKKLM